MASAEQPSPPPANDPTAVGAAPSGPPDATPPEVPERQYAQDITGVGQPNMTNSQREYLRALRGLRETPRVKQRVRVRNDDAPPGSSRPVPSRRVRKSSRSSQSGPGLTSRLRRRLRGWFRPSIDRGGSRGPIGKLFSLARGKLSRWSRRDRWGPRREMNRQNIRRTLVALPVAAAALYGLHDWQVRRAAPLLLNRVAALEELGQFNASAYVLRQYVQLRPQDEEARKRLAETLSRLSETAADGAVALRFRQEAVQLLPSNAAQHRALAELALRQQRYDVAEKEADTILRLVPRDFSATRLRSLAAYGRLITGRDIAVEEVVKSLERAAEQTPGDAEIAITLASLYRERYHVPSKTVSAATADGLMEKLVSSADKKAASYLARAWYRESYGLNGADEDFDKALELEPNDVEIHMAIADHARRHQQYVVAEQHYQRAKELAPEDLRTYLGWGQLLLDRGDAKEAQLAWALGLEVHREHPDPAVALILRLRQAEADIVTGRIEDPSQALEAVKGDVQNLSLRLTPVQQSQFETALDVLLARYWLVQRKFDKALPLLKQSMTSTSASQLGTAWTEVQLRYHMAACYEGLGQIDRSAELYEESSRLEPAQPRHFLRAGRAWGLTGRWQRAVELLEQAVTMPSCPAEAWVALAHSQLLYQLSLPVVERDMAGLERALVAANDRGVTLDALPLLTADAQTMAGNEQNALSALAAAQRQRPESSRLLRAYALLLDHLGRGEEADQAIKNFETLHGLTLEIDLLKADLAQARGAMDVAQTTLAKAQQLSVGEGQRSLLALEQAELALQTKQWDEARATLTTLAEEHPEQLSVIDQLARLELSLGEFNNLEEWEQRLRELEGEEGASWRYYRARRILAEATGPADPRLNDVRRLQSEIETLRPGWPPAYILAGRLADVEGQRSRARKAYQTAIEFGDADVESYERLAALAYEEHDLLEASQILSMLGESVSKSTSLSSLALYTAVQQGEFDHMLQIATDAVRVRPDDAMARVWLGQALTLMGRRPEAEQALAAARDKAGDDFRPALSLIEFFVNGGDVSAARKVLEQLAADTQIEPAGKAFALAQGYELTLDDKAAERHYREAARLAPERESVQVRAAAFFHDRDPDAAAQARAQALTASRAEGDTRRALALALVRRGGAKNLAAALELFRERINVEQADRWQDIRLTAYLALRYGAAEDRVTAMTRMEQLLEQEKTGSSDDYALLARLLEADEQLVAASEQLAKAASPLNPAPEHVAAYADVLLRLQRVADVRPWLEKLAAAEPGSLRTLNLRGRYLNLNGQPEQIVTEIGGSLDKQYAKLSTDVQKAAFSWQAATLCDTLEQIPLAERWYRRGLEIDSRGYPSYVRFLVRRGRSDDALRLTQQALDQKPSPEVVQLLCEIIVRARLAEDALKPLLPQIRQVVVKFSHDPDLLTAAADLYWLSLGETDDAEKLYRRAIRVRPDHLTALNNLAVMTAENSNELGEAQRWIEQAINFGGHLPWLEDTHAMLLLKQGDAPHALRILRELSAGRHSTPLTLFHLACAHHQGGDSTLARLRFRQAVERNLDGELLTPAERKLRQELESALAE